MKKSILGISLILITLNSFAQGTLLFTSHTTDRDSHIWGPAASAPDLSLFGPGANDNPSGSTPYQASGMTLIGANGSGGPYGYATTFAQLLAAPGVDLPESSLEPMGPATTFHSGATAGQIVAIAVPLTGMPPDTSLITVEAVAWDNSSGLYPTWSEASVAWAHGLIAAGISYEEIITLDAGSGTYVPETFNLYRIPEPSTFALAGLAAAALSFYRRRG